MSVLENEKIIRSALATHKRCYLHAVLLEVFGKNEPLDIYGVESHLISEVQKTGVAAITALMSFLPTLNILIRKDRQQQKYRQ